MAAVLKAGNLRKEGASSLSKTNTRLFVLHENQLAYFVPLAVQTVKAVEAVADDVVAAADKGPDADGVCAFGRLRARVDSDGGRAFLQAIRECACAPAPAEAITGLDGRANGHLPLDLAFRAAQGTIPCLQTACRVLPDSQGRTNGSADWFDGLLVCEPERLLVFAVAARAPPALAQRGQIPLHGPAWLAAVEESGESGFTVRTEQRAYHLTADTPKERDAWVTAVSAAVDALAVQQESLGLASALPQPSAAVDALAVQQESSRLASALPQPSAGTTCPSLSSPGVAAGSGPDDGAPDGEAGVLCDDETPGGAGGAQAGPADEATTDPGMAAHPCGAHPVAAGGSQACVEGSGAGGAPAPGGLDESDLPARPVVRGESGGVQAAAVVLWYRLALVREREHVLSAFATWRRFAEAEVLARVEDMLARFVELTVGEAGTPDMLRSSYVPLGDEFGDASMSYAPFGEGEGEDAVDDLAEEAGEAGEGEGGLDAALGAGVPGRRHAVVERRGGREEDAGRCRAPAPARDETEKPLSADARRDAAVDTSQGISELATESGEPKTHPHLVVSGAGDNLLGRALPGALSSPMTPGQRSRRPTVTELQGIIDELEEGMRHGGVQRDQMLELLARARALTRGARASACADGLDQGVPTPRSRASSVSGPSPPVAGPRRGVELPATPVVSTWSPLHAAAMDAAEEPSAGTNEGVAASVRVETPRRGSRDLPKATSVPTPPTATAKSVAPKSLAVRIRSTATLRDDRGRYTAYEVAITDSEMTWVVWRRYKQFEVLHSYMLDERGFVPGLPPKSRMPLRPRIVAQRRAQLERYLVELTANLSALNPEQRRVLGRFLNAPHHVAEA